MKLRTIGYALIVAVAAVALAIGSATTGEAKGKKKKVAAPPPQPQICFYQAVAPVCGSLKGQKFTYANSCAAWKDGATIVANHACPVKKAAKHHKKKRHHAKKKPMKKKS